MMDYRTEALTLIGQDENKDILAMGFTNPNIERIDGIIDIYVFLKKDHNDKIPAAIFDYNEKHSDKNKDKVVFFDEEYEDICNSPKLTLFYAMVNGISVFA